MGGRREGGGREGGGEGRGGKLTAEARPFSAAVAAVAPAKNCIRKVPISSAAAAGVSVGLSCMMASIAKWKSWLLGEQETAPGTAKRHY